MATITRIIDKDETGIFGHLDIGDYFEYKDDLFIRIFGVETYTEKNECCYLNAINLSKNGILTPIDYGEKITLVDNNSVTIEYKLKR